MAAFDSYESTSYDSNLAYKINMKPDIIEYINTNTNFNVQKLNWLFIIKSPLEVELKIDSLKILKDQKFVIKWIVWNNIGNLDIKKEDDLETYYNLSWDFYKKSYSFVVSQITHYQKMFSIKVDIHNQKDLDKITNTINAIVTISPQIIYWSDLEKEIKININGEQTNHVYTWKSISKPDSYIFLDQLLWDEFSLQSLLSQE